MIRIERRNKAMRDRLPIGLVLAVALLTGVGVRAAGPPRDLVRRGSPQAAQDKPQRLSLDQCLQIAETRHPDVAAAQALVVAASQRVKEAHSAYHPEIDLGASYTRETYNFGASPGVSPKQYDAFRAPQSNSSANYYFGGLTANQTIFDFGARRGSVNYSLAELSAAEQELSRTRQVVALNVRVAYFAVLAAEEEMKVVDQTVANFQRHLNQAEAYYEVGRSPRIDVTEQQVALATAEVNHRDAEENLQVARAALATSMGLPVDQAPEPAGALETLESFGPLESLLAEAERQRPDILAAERRVDAAQAQVVIAHSALRPTFAFSSLFDYKNLQFPLVYNWGLAGALSQTLLNGGLNKARLAEAQAEENAAESTLQSLEERVRQEVYNDYAALEVARDKIDLNQKVIAEAKENLDLAEGRYENGYGNVIELNDAQLQLTQSQVNEITSRLDYHTAASQLDAALGRQP
jgi:outer membrane protein